MACALAGSDITVGADVSLQALRSEGTVRVSTGTTLTLAMDSEVATFELAGAIGGGAPLVVDTLSWSGGVVAGGIDLAVGAADGVSPSTISGPVELCDSAALTVHGELVLSGTSTGVTSASCPTATVSVAVGVDAEVRASGSAVLDVATSVGGTLAVDAASTLTMASAPTMLASGTVALRAADATLSLGGGAASLSLDGATLRGMGVLDASVLGPGTIAADPIATLTVSGNVAGPGLSVPLVFGGPSPGQGPGSLAVTGVADLSGAAMPIALDTEIGGLAGDQFTVVSGASLDTTGTTTSIEPGRGLGAWLDTDTDADPDQLTLRVTRCDAAVFHPGANVSTRVTGNAMSGCDLRGARFTVSMGSYDLTASRLDGGWFYQSGLQGSNLTDASLRGARGITSLSPSSLSNTICPDGTNSDANGDTCTGHLDATLLTVNTTDDVVDLAPGDGACDTGGPPVVGVPQCSLRAAVMEANARPGFDTISLSPVAYTLTIPGDGEDAAVTGDLDLTDSAVFLGSASTDPTVLAAPGIERILDVAPGVDAVLVHEFDLMGGVDSQVRNRGATWMALRPVNSTSRQSAANSSLAQTGATAAIENDGRLWIDGVRVVGADPAAVGIGGAGPIQVENSYFESASVRSDGDVELSIVDITGVPVAVSAGGRADLYRLIAREIGDVVIDAGSGPVAIDRLTATDVRSGVRSAGAVTIEDSTLTASTVDAGVGLSASAGDIEVSDVALSGFIDGVEVEAGSAGIDVSTVVVSGDAVQATGDVTVAMSTIDAGGAAVATPAAAHVTGSSITAGDLGVVAGDGSTIDVTTITGAATAGVLANGDLLVDRATVSGNGGVGLGSTAGTTTVVDTTVTDNGIGLDPDGGTFALSSTIIGDQSSGPDCTGPVLSNGWNLDSDGSCELAGEADISGASPQLGPLEQWYALGSTHRPGPTSPVLDAGRPDCAGVDAQNTARPIDSDADGTAGCEIGAIEVGRAADLTFDVTTKADEPDAVPGDGICATAAGECSLPAALRESELAFGAHVLHLTLAGSYPTSTVRADVSIDGLAAPGTATLRHMTVAQEHTVDLERVSVSGIDNPSSTMTLRDVRISAGGGADGVRNGGSVVGERVAVTSAAVGLHNLPGGTMQFERVLVSGAEDGGVRNDGQLELVDATVTNNRVYGFEGIGETRVANSVIERQQFGAPSCVAPLHSDGTNVADDDGCGLDATDDELVTTGVLVPAGATNAGRPLAGSAAVDSGRAGCGADAYGAVVGDGDGDGSAACDRGAIEAPEPTELDLVVTSTGDGVDASIGDGVCETATPGECTLRAALQEANRAHGADHIVVTPGLAIPVPTASSDDDLGAKGDLDIWGPVTIDGAGATLGATSGSAADLLHVRAGVGVEVRDVQVLTGARVATVAGELALVDTTITSTGLITSSGTLTLDGVTATRSSWSSASTGLSTTGTVDVRDSSLSGWSTALESHGDASVAGSAVTGSIRSGGALDVDVSVIAGSIVSTDAAAAAVVTDSVVTYNGPPLNIPLGAATFTSSTIITTSNSPAVTAGGAVTATNTVISGPCSAPITSGGHNVSTSSTCGLSAPTDLSASHVVAPSSKVLAPVSAPVPISVSATMTIPAVLDSDFADCSSFDLRGVARTDSDGDGTPECERGAIELGTHQPLTIAVNSAADVTDATPGDGVCETVTAGQCTLRAAIVEANASVGTDTVTLQAFTTYELDGSPSSAGEEHSGDLDIWSPLVLRGQLSTVRDGDVEVFGGPLTVRDLTFQGTTVRSYASQLIFERARWPYGGSVIAAGTVSVTDSTGVGLDLGAGSTATVARSQLTGASTQGTLTVTQSVAESLMAHGSGSAVLDRVQLTGEAPSLVQGGAATVSLTDVTVRGGANLATPGAVTATNTIFGERAGGSATCTAPITSNGWNLAADASCGLSSPSDLVVAETRLGHLASNGGSWPTILPLPDSPAVDAGRPGCTAVDVRGRPRPVDGDGDGTAACDIGATELGPVASLTLTVDSAADAVDTAPGDGLCRTSSGSCTARAAAMEANTSNGPDTILLTPGVGGSMATGHLALDTEIVLDGRGSNLYGWAAWGVSIDAQGQPVELRNVGIVSGNGEFTMLVSATPVLFDQAQTDLAVIADNSEITVRESSRLGGLTARADTGFVAPAGGTWTPAVHVFRATIGGQVTAKVPMDILQSRVASIYAHAPVTIDASTVNTDTTVGVDQRAVVSYPGAVVTITNSTIASYVNTIQGFEFTETITNSGGTITLTNSIVTGGCTGPVVSGGWNLGCGDQATDLVGVDPLLGPFQLNGGPTSTYLPDALSPAIDSGAPTCGAVDQRGVARPVGAGCDRGAVERQ